MPRYKSRDIAELAHQLMLSPRRQRMGQIAGAERLLELVEPGTDYPYDFVCFHLTGYRPLRPSKKSGLRGRFLISDIVRLIEQLSQSAAIPLTSLSKPAQTQEQLSQRLSVSMKTIARWRQRGLSGLRVLDEDRVSRLVFTERALQRFVERNRELVQRGGAFRQLTEQEREAIIREAADLVAGERMKLQEVARTLAAKTHRAVETIRYTLRRHDRANPQAALFGPSGRPKVPDSYTAVYQAHRAGADTACLAREHDLSPAQIERICLEMRAYELQNRKLSYVYHPEFDAPGALQRILDGPEPQVPDDALAAAATPPHDAPAYLKSLYSVPLLTQPQEQDLFRRYNFCKYQAHILIQQLDPGRAGRKLLDEIDRLMSRADEYQQRLIRANLRLVVSIAGRHLRRGMEMPELISDGNMSLMRAVDRFDFSRGYKFSTYASWAIMKNYARSIPEERYRYTRYVTGREELLDAAADRSSAAGAAQPTDNDGLRSALACFLGQLDGREREILTCHYGLDQNHQPTTLEQLGARFGVTKERVRQIEKRALAKLRKLLPPSLAEHAAL